MNFSGLYGAIKQAAEQAAFVLASYISLASI